MLSRVQRCLGWVVDPAASHSILFGQADAILAWAWCLQQHVKRQYCQPSDKGTPCFAFDIDGVLKQGEEVRDHKDSFGSGSSRVPACRTGSARMSVPWDAAQSQACHKPNPQGCLPGHTKMPLPARR
jgi:hypothetical protein